MELDEQRSRSDFYRTQCSCSPWPGSSLAIAELGTGSVLRCIWQKHILCDMVPHGGEPRIFRLLAERLNQLGHGTEKNFESSDINIDRTKSCQFYMLQLPGCHSQETIQYRNNSNNTPDNLWEGTQRREEMGLLKTKRGRAQVLGYVVFISALFCALGAFSICCM